eukprot:m.182746 g.182746  ORF g.182746 m.182746 type:complete len:530 (-) comp14982_c0_seq3:1032-2621(-)
MERVNLHRARGLCATLRWVGGFRLLGRASGIRLDAAAGGSGGVGLVGHPAERLIRQTQVEVGEGLPDEVGQRLPILHFLRESIVLLPAVQLTSPRHGLRPVERERSGGAPLCGHAVEFPEGPLPHNLSVQFGRSDLVGCALAGVPHKDQRGAPRGLLLKEPRRQHPPSDVFCEWEHDPEVEGGGEEGLQRLLRPVPDLVLGERKPALLEQIQHLRLDRQKRGVLGVSAALLEVCPRPVVAWRVEAGGACVLARQGGRRDVGVRRRPELITQLVHHFDHPTVPSLRRIPVRCNRVHREVTKRHELILVEGSNGCGEATTERGWTECHGDKDPSQRWPALLPPRREETRDEAPLVAPLCHVGRLLPPPFPWRSGGALGVIIVAFVRRTRRVHLAKTRGCGGGGPIGVGFRVIQVHASLAFGLDPHLSRWVRKKRERRCLCLRWGWRGRGRFPDRPPLPRRPLPRSSAATAAASLLWHPPLRHRVSQPHNPHFALFRLPRCCGNERSLRDWIQLPRHMPSVRELTLGAAWPL